ncbi:flavin-containing monooxygenase [Nocardia sp. NPDC052566]|uniref:flavin-containing monooxygenase n=1 Tax=Nocardia sp. NPDC052566 TaxID=3364330 RepID=UPI0037C85FFA
MGKPEIAIIGAGFGGLAAAIELSRNGIDSYEVLERADEVGGAWRANTYPGAACDVPSAIYSYSFALEPDWSARFSTQPEIKDYLHRCADDYDVSSHIRFGTEVVAATFVDDRWQLEFQDGQRRTYDAVITATGLLSRPRIPELSGLETFSGVSFHSAEWNHDVDLSGKRVVVVGSGASAIQVVPEIVDDVAALTVVQRSPNWVMDRHNYGRSPRVRALLRRFPILPRLQHNLEFLWHDARAPLIYRRLDPLRAGMHLWMRMKIRRQIKDRELRAAVTPNYLAACNRLLMSNDWFPALDRAHVNTYRQGIDRVTEHGIELSDGTAVDADVIIWCTGFTPDEYLAPIDITGRDGRKLRTEWKAGPEAYLGVAVSGYPNFFMLYGPGTVSSVNSVIFMLEKEARYARMLVQRIAETGGWLDVRQDRQDEYNADRQRRLATTVYAAGCPGWYAKDGKVFAPWPGSHTSFARATRTVDFTAFEHGGVRAAVARIDS